MKPPHFHLVAAVVLTGMTVTMIFIEKYAPSLLFGLGAFVAYINSRMCLNFIKK
jgi:hypothetical protein